MQVPGVGIYSKIILLFYSSAVNHTISVCVVPPHEMIHLLLNFPVCIADFIKLQKGLLGSWFSIPNWGPTINDLL